MKRKLILLPITLTVLTPTISIVGCDNNSNEPTEPVEFNVSSSETTGLKTATVYIDWQPSEDQINFSNLSFVSQTIEIDSASFIDPESHPRPQGIALEFKQPISENLDDCIIKFDYYDTTLKVSGQAEIEDVHINQCFDYEINVNNLYDDEGDIGVDSNPTSVLNDKLYKFNFDMSKLDPSFFALTCLKGFCFCSASTKEPISLEGNYDIAVFWDGNELQPTDSRARLDETNYFIAYEGFWMIYTVIPNDINKVLNVYLKLENELTDVIARLGTQ